MKTCVMPLITSPLHAYCQEPIAQEVDFVPLCWLHANAVRRGNRRLSETQGGAPAIGYHGNWPLEMRRPPPKTKKKKGIP